MPNDEYPLNDKFNRVHELTHAIASFLDWTEKQKGMRLCEPYKPQYAWYVPSHGSREKLLLEFFGIDLAELENEKRKMAEQRQKAA
jgi:hypothetical protein